MVALMETTPEATMNLDSAGLEVLDKRQCLRLLAAADRGRIAINVRALPMILPVRFVLDGERVVFCTGPDAVLARATDDHVVAFQADGKGPDATEWSVSAVGMARHLVTPEDVARAATLRLRRWSTRGHPCFVTVSTDHISGRYTLPSSG
jgi:nitroimidazol reductase NimA-like FMN-containing flavoprotein (pyridoxamine 5'-phosphate oxidase superfamily)